jgi:16S rRNA (cytosine1402-N4)-methyltransferase
LQKQKQAKMHQNSNQNKNKQHIPILLSEVLTYLEPKEGDSYLDLTAGYGGHAKAILERTGSLTNSVLVDRDINAIMELEKAFEPNTVSLRHQDFLSVAEELLDDNRQFDTILADLGVSSPHLNQSSRGFSISENGPLDMRMDQSQELTAEIVVNSFSEDELTDIISRYGEDPKSRQIARAIIRSRPLTTTDELAAIAKRVWPGRSRVHPATRTFQAIRIAVNDELVLIEKALPIWLKLLSPGGRIAIISFHSLEDRLVKSAFKEVSGQRFDAEFSLLTKSPITPSQDEIVFNPRARSAKLRAAVKIKKKGNLHANTGKK